MKCNNCGKEINGNGRYLFVADDIEICQECKDRAGPNFWRMPSEINDKRQTAVNCHYDEKPYGPSSPCRFCDIKAICKQVKEVVNEKAVSSMR